MKMASERSKRRDFLACIFIEKSFPLDIVIMIMIIVMKMTMTMITIMIVILIITLTSHRDYFGTPRILPVIVRETFASVPAPFRSPVATEMQVSVLEPG